LFQQVVTSGWQDAVKAKLDLARPNNKDSPTGKRQQELRGQLAEIRTKQQAGKTSRTATLDKVKRLDEQLKSRIQENNAARGKVNYKNVQEIDSRVAELQKQVDTGTMKLVDEKKALSEISSLNKTKKSFSGFEQAQKGIDDVKAQIAELKKQMDDPESKAMSDKYTEIAKELDQIKAEQDAAFKDLNTLRDERSKLHDEQNVKWSAMKAVKDNFFQSKRAFRDYEFEARRQRDQKRREEQKTWEAGKRKETATRKLEEASTPAYQDEILTAQGLIRYFDPNSVEAKQAAGPSKFAASAQRTVDGSGLKGTALKSKKDEEQESYFVGTGGKKGKKGRKGAAASPAPGTPTEGKFNMSIGIIEELGKVGVNAPGSQGEVPEVVEQLKKKLAQWKEDQDRQTKEVSPIPQSLPSPNIVTVMTPSNIFSRRQNIAKAQKEIDRLEADSTGPTAASGSDDRSSKDPTSKPAPANQAVNGDKADAAAAADADHKKAVAEKDAADEMKELRMEDGGEEEVPV